MSVDTPRPSIPTYTIDISTGYDTEEQKKIFFKNLHEAPFYREGLLFSCTAPDDEPFNAEYEASMDLVVTEAIGEYKPIYVYDESKLEDLTATWYEDKHIPVCKLKPYGIKEEGACIISIELK